MKYPILDRYILKKYLFTFLLAMALIIVIVITFDVSEKLDDFLSNHAPFREIVVNYYCNFIPGFVNLYSPLFIFISVIFFTSKMAGHTEIIAILGSGISYRRLLRPYLHGALLVAGLVLVIGNFVIPWSNQYLSEFEQKYIKSSRRNYYTHVHFQPAPQKQVYAESYDVVHLTVNRFQQDTYSKEGQLRQRIEAQSLTYDTAAHTWHASDCFIRTVDGLDEKLTHHKACSIALPLAPTDFEEYAVDITTLNTPKLCRHIERESMRGSARVTYAKIELWQRLLNPLAIIVMTLIGVSISSRKTRGGIGVHLAIGISIAFAFIVFMKITTVFATNSTLSPFMAVLLPQIVFGLAALYLIRTAPK
ncbi:MAG: YjgP/YjgQ family permease [Bacteroidales bacterium]|nr:YjgP/YjgQ family permease [Bacteroidales bacterium]